MGTICLQFEFGNVDFFGRICICLIVDLLAQGTQFCESGYQINLKKVKKPKKIKQSEIFYFNQTKVPVTFFAALGWRQIHG